MKLKLTIILVVFTLGFIRTKAQQPLFKQFSTEQGLPCSEIYAIFQDSKGFIWTGSNFGVSRFDGYTFKNFDLQDGLPEMTIFDITEDSKGRIWFIGFNNKISYYENGTIKVFPFNRAIQHLTLGHRICIKNSFYVDANDNVYVSFRYFGLIKITPKGFVTRIDKKHDNIASIIEVDRQLLIAQHSGIFNKLDFRTSLFKTSIVNKLLVPALNRSIIAIKATDNKSIFVACDKYLIRVFNDGHYETRVMTSPIIWLSKDNNHSLWVCSLNSGAVAIDENDFQGPIKYSYLNKESVSSIIQDREGGYWFSTLENGIFYLSSHFTSSIGIKNGLANENIACIESSNDLIFAGTGGGYLSIVKDTSITNILTVSKQPAEITCLLYDNDLKQLYLSVSAEQFIYKDNRLTPLINFSHEQNKPFIGKILVTKVMTKASKTTMWIGTTSGFALIDLIKRDIIYYSNEATKIGFRVTAIYVYPDGSLLIGSSDGLWHFKDKKLKKATDIFPEVNDRIICIAGSKSGDIIAVATKGSGVFIKAKGSVIHLSRKEGLLTNSQLSLYLNNNELWMGSNQGVSSIKIKSLKPFRYNLNNYTKDDGLISNQVFDLTSYKNKILAATNKGISIIDNDNFKLFKGNIPLFFTRTRLMMKDTILPNNCSLPNSLNSLSFNYVAITYQSLAKIQYQYRLLGLDDKWITTKNTEVIFPFLPANNYELQVRTINDIGFPSSVVISKKFTIMRPYWQTLWFNFLLLIFLFGIGYNMYRKRIKRIELENLTKQEINQYRQQALSKQMNPHFLFNSLNSIQYYIVKNDKVSSSRYLSKFATLMRMILNNSQHQAISLNEELSALKLYLELEAMRFKEHFEYTIEIDPVIDQVSTFIPPFIIQPFIENSIWHGLMNREEKGLLQIKLTYKENSISCIVEDNGVGRKKSQEIQENSQLERTSRGIAITETRLKLFDVKKTTANPIIYTDLCDENGEAIGTRVEIIIPIVI